ncbi:hemerythrin domain-containing protein [Aneurinibacillus sp. Ricciae_BoGa-3]|uniref:hemerythrin domain-containing protein n=1 Tax=Aneurinibacillus sp. Ricciae_BoGa-3 TaxID=3022697 RepID=UPI0023426D50|nr:hemerythrin domain-containing protein [Aneurinibacillus sp. Ricciae_BoGa-3]WCK55489.1 hemerythrin domain-containing protein [Aneurinibacillus sp. Ricciae_BoGa-3]
MKCIWGSLQDCQECLFPSNFPKKYKAHVDDHTRIRKIACTLANLLEEVNKGFQTGFTFLYEEIEKFKNACEHHIAIEEEVVFPVIAEAWNREVVYYLKEEHLIIKESLANVQFITSILKQNDTVEPLLWKNFEEALWDIIELLREHWYKEELFLLPLVSKVLDENKQRIICSAFGNS